MMRPYQSSIDKIMEEMGLKAIEISSLRNELLELHRVCNEQAKEITRLKEENYKLHRELNTQVPITVEHSKH